MREAHKEGMISQMAMSSVRSHYLGLKEREQACREMGKSIPGIRNVCTEVLQQPMARRLEQEGSGA